MKRFRNGYSRRIDLHDINGTDTNKKVSYFHFKSYRRQVIGLILFIPIHFLIKFKFKRFPSFELPVPIPSVQPVERMSSRRTSEPGVIKSQTAV